MKLNSNEKLKRDLEDFWRILEGVKTYAELDIRGVIDRHKTHPEDVFCKIADYAGTGKKACTRDAYDAILGIAERHRNSLPVPEDYSRGELAEAICKHFARAVVDEQEDERALARVLTMSVNEATAKHVSRTFHFPCVIVSSNEPAQFSIGPVSFARAEVFPQLFKADIDRYLSGDGGRGCSTELVHRFRDITAEMGWIATVKISPCGEESAKRRAEGGISTALNILRVVFGIAYARDMGLAHVLNVTPTQSSHAVTIDGRMDFVFSTSFRGATATPHWYEAAIRQHPTFWSQAAHLVAASIGGIRSEAAERLIDALNWFSRAAFEASPGSRIISFVAALERLTSTEWFHIHNFCSRVALLARDQNDDLEKCYWDAYNLHNARSAVMHGAFSPEDQLFLKSLKRGHEITRYALFRGLEVHCLLDDSGNRSGIARFT